MGGGQGVAQTQAGVGQLDGLERFHQNFQLAGALLQEAAKSLGLLLGRLQSLARGLFVCGGRRGREGLSGREEWQRFLEEVQLAGDGGAVLAGARVARVGSRARVVGAGGQGGEEVAELLLLQLYVEAARGLEVSAQLLQPALGGL